nr:MAG TPA: hypothetical protein [Caudoviricetes sp.]
MGKTYSHSFLFRLFSYKYDEAAKITLSCFIFVKVQYSIKQQFPLSWAYCRYEPIGSDHLLLNYASDKPVDNSRE